MLAQLLNSVQFPEFKYPSHNKITIITNITNIAAVSGLYNLQYQQWKAFPVVVLFLNLISRIVF